MQNTSITPINIEALVRKSNHVNEAITKLTVQHQRLLAILISAIRPDDAEMQTHTFAATEIAEICQLDARNYYKEARQIVSELLRKTLLLREDDGKLYEFQWLSVGVYHEEKGLISMAIHPKLQPYFLQLQSRFVQYQLGDVLQLKSKYSIRLFELLKQYLPIGERTFELEEIRKMIGVEDGELTLFADFKKRAIEPAIDEINAKSPILVSVEYIKISRAVAFLKFKIKEKVKIPEMMEFSVITEEPGIEDLLNLIPDSIKRLKSTRNLLNKALKKYDYDYIKETILYTNTREIRKDYLALLGTNLTNNYAEVWIEKKKLKEEQRKRQESEAAQKDKNDIECWIGILKEKSSEELEKIAAEIVRNKKRALAAQAILNERAQTKL
jgi:hypothetical protein